MKGNIGNMMKQAQEMQDNLKKAQDELAPLEVEGQSGARPGEGHDDLQARRQARVDRPSLLADDKDMLEDLVAAAFNDAVRKAERRQQEKMGKLTAGMPLPPGMKMPF